MRRMACGAPVVAEGSDERRKAADEPAWRQNLRLSGLLERVELCVGRGCADAQLRRDVILAACSSDKLSRCQFTFSF